MDYRSLMVEKINMKKKGFTYLEIIVVVGVIGLVLPALFAILFAIISQQTKLYALQEVKRQGDSALSIIENTIKKNAVGIYSDLNLTTEKCKDTDQSYNSIDGTTFWFKDKQGVAFKFYLGPKTDGDTTNSILLYTPTTNDSITPSNIDVSTPISGIFISCYRTGTFVPPIVTVQFIVTHIPTSTSLTYTTKVKLYSY